MERAEGEYAGGEAPSVGKLLRSRGLRVALAVCLAGDVAILVICPILGGDCLYGFLTLIALPVILSGPLGLVVPRQAAWAAQQQWPWGVTGRGAELAVWLGGLAALAVVILIGHVIAIRILNVFDYGGIFVRPRLLQIGLGLAAVYYAGLGAIAVAMRPSSAP